MRFFLFDSYESPLSIGLIKTGGQKYDSVPLKSTFSDLAKIFRVGQFKNAESKYGSLKIINTVSYTHQTLPTKA